MNSLNNLCNIIDSKSLHEKNASIIELNQKIEHEKNILNNMMENINKIDTNFIITLKYINMSLEELEIIFNNCNDITEQITLYHIITIKIKKHKEELYEI